MICPACRTNLADGSRFCPSCGVALAGATGQIGTGELLLDRYRILRALARGGMSALYLAEDTRLGDAPVAVKEMAHVHRPGDTEAYADAVQLFRREAAILARLSHTNLPRVIDQFEVEGRQFLVMEYIDGQTLGQYVERNGRPELSQLLGWADQLCEVLGYLHRQPPPIIYRDLKPSNVMLRADGRLVLIDFGIARFYKPGQAGDTVSFGTLGYAPPEQYGKGQTDARTDIYAMGVLLHRLLTGYDPASTPFRRPPLTQLRPDLPASLSAVIDGATANNPEDRFESMAELRAALHAALRPPAPAEPTVIARPPSVQPPVEPRAAPQPRPVRHSRVPMYVGAALLVLLLGGVLALLASGQLSALLASRPATAQPSAISLAVVTETPAQSATAVAATPTLPGKRSDDRTPLAPTTPPAVALLIRPAAVLASQYAVPSQDRCGNPTSYEPERAVDGQPDTAWRVEGAGLGDWIELELPALLVVTRVGIIPGLDKVDPCDGSDRFYQGHLVQRVRLEFDGGAAVEAELDERRAMQYIDVPPVQTRRVRMTILQTRSSFDRDVTAVGEVEVWGHPGR